MPTYSQLQVDPKRIRAQRKYELALRGYNKDLRQRVRNFKRDLARPEYLKEKGLPLGLVQQGIDALAESMAIEQMIGKRPHPRDFM